MPPLFISATDPGGDSHQLNNNCDGPCETNLFSRAPPQQTQTDSVSWYCQPAPNPHPSPPVHYLRSDGVQHLQDLCYNRNYEQTLLRNRSNIIEPRPNHRDISVQSRNNPGFGYSNFQPNNPSISLQCPYPTEPSRYQISTIGDKVSFHPDLFEVASLGPFIQYTYSI